MTAIRISGEVVERMTRLHESLNLPTRFEDFQIAVKNPHLILEAMKHDKKTENGKLRFVLPTRLGACELVDGIEPETVLDIFAG